MNIEELKQRASQGDAEAQFELGCAYEVGDGIQRNYRVALEYYLTIEC